VEGEEDDEGRDVKEGTAAAAVERSVKDAPVEIFVEDAAVADKAEVEDVAVV
jgi:hypothetical protein